MAHLYKAYARLYYMEPSATQGNMYFVYSTYYVDLDPENYHVTDSFGVAADVPADSSTTNSIESAVRDAIIAAGLLMDPPYDLKNSDVIFL